MPAPLFWPLLPLHALMSALAATLALRRGPHAWRGLLEGVRTFGIAWRARRKIQNGRVASVSEIARALAWSPIVFVGRQPVIRPLR
jgi:hypothetical protein